MKIRALAASLLFCVSAVGSFDCFAGPGSPDMSFGTNGMVVTGLGGGYAEAHASLAQPDGKLLMAGFNNPLYGHLQNYQNGGDFLIARFTTNNVLDPSFGDHGRTLTQVSTNYERYNSSVIRALGLQSDGKIIAAGYSFQNTNYSSFTMVRYTTNGMVDTTFGTNGTGIVTTDFGQFSEVHALALQSGSILLVGSVVAGNGTAEGVALARYDSNGIPDTSFGTGGTGTVVTSGNEYTGNAVMISSDSKIVVAGSGVGPGDSRADIGLFRYTTNGVLDNTFATNGMVFKRISSSTFDYTCEGAAVATQFGDQTIANPDKIIVAGTYDNEAISPNQYFQVILRYKLDGTIDTTFGNNGVVTNAIGPQTVWGQHCVGVSVQGFLGTARKITIVGYGTDSTNDFYTIARFTSAGLFDTTFGTNSSGKSVVTVTSDLYQDAIATATTLQSGNFVVAGYAGYSFGAVGFAAVRFTSAGILDTNFGSGGILRADLSDALGAQSFGTAIQSDGKIVAVGTTPPIYDLSANTDLRQFAVVRYNPDGSLDSSFGNLGKTVTKIGSNDLANAVAIQPDGKIVVAGESDYSNSSRYALARYNADGTLDTSFGTNGVLAIQIGGGSGTPSSVHIQADGKIIAAGSSTGGGNSQFAIARWTSNGVLDTNFGSGGTVITTVGSLGSGSIAYASAIGPNGKIVAGGLVVTPNGSSATADFGAARYNTNGALDLSFGTFGRATANVGGGTLDAGYGLAIQPDGKIIIAGTASLGNVAGPASQFTSVSSFVALVRLNTNGALDSTFGNSGSVVTQVGAFSDFALAVALQPDGKILVGGASQNGMYKFFALRYLTNGGVDSSYGINGATVLDFGSGTNEVAYGLALDSFGRAVLAGDAGGQFAVARLTGDFAVVPSLKIWMTATNTAVVSWPFPSAGWSLQENVSANGNVWGAPGEAINNDGTNNFIVVTPPVGNMFYRLKE